MSRSIRFTSEKTFNKIKSHLKKKNSRGEHFNKYLHYNTIIHYIFTEPVVFIIECMYE